MVAQLIPPDTNALELLHEDELIAELETLGIHYLSRHTQSARPRFTRPTFELLADIVRQPSSRVRLMLIPVLLSHPDYAEASSASLGLLQPSEQVLFKFFYTAAVLLQRDYAEALRPYLQTPWHWLPDLFSAELGIPQPPPSDALRVLAHIHAERSGAHLNWYGTYQHAVQQWLRRQKKQAQWNQSHLKSS